MTTTGPMTHASRTARRPTARRTGRVVDRPNEPGGALDEHQGLALIPRVVAKSHGIGAGIDEFAIDGLGDAESAGGVFAVDDDEIELPVADQPG